MIQKSRATVIPISIKNDSANHIAVTDTETSWQTALKKLITDPDELLDLLAIHDKQYRHAARRASQLFPLRATRSYIKKIQPGNTNDPLLRQILPINAELHNPAGYSNDPTGDQYASQSPGLLHKYHGRVLLILTSACAIHCRYCFRREYPYTDNSATRQNWQHISDYLHQHTSVDEVILSGGDPLMLSNTKLSELLQIIASVPHIKRLRIHSRIPIVLPERMTTELCQLLSQHRCQVIMVVHSNHPQELDNTVKTAIKQLKDRNITVLNQAVLLKGVNDSADILVQLSKKLFDYGILPYYLHVLDKVNGAAHFDLQTETIQSLHKHLLDALPGYLVPKLVQDLPQEASKTPWF